MNRTRKSSSPIPSATGKNAEDYSDLPVLSRPVTVVRMIGGYRQRALVEFGIRTLGDLLEFYPRKYIDRSHIVRIADVRLTEHELTVVGEVQYANLMKSRRGKEWLAVGLNDGSGLLECVWFQGTSYWSRQLKEGEWIAASGTIEEAASKRFVHPAIDRLGDDGDRELFNTGRIIPLYPGGMALKKVGLESRLFRQIMVEALRIASGDLEEYLPLNDLLQINALTRFDSLRQIHSPDSTAELNSAWKRVRYEELFMQQLLFAMLREKNRTSPGNATFDHIGPLTRKTLDALPFQLTEGQKQVLSEIRHDLQSGIPMRRLLQGEVGTGKTTVALLAMAMAADAGYQSVMMAPTELLASQHAQRLLDLSAAAGLSVRLLRGKQPARERYDVLQSIANEATQIVVGTHALIQNKVEFSKLGLVVIDEQHRFGVEQRAALHSKGIRPHLLLMTATPIPRSLRLAQVGDLDVSTLRELPGGARQIVTVVRTEVDRPKIYKFLVEEAQRGHRVFIVCPLIEESEKVDTESVVNYHLRVSSGPLKAVRVGLLHGRMKIEEKALALSRFRSGETPILVATPVIEVGVDVPEATVMLIENAERFGLAALHQLRGRVGRRGQKGYFIMLPGPRMTAEADARLKALVESDDGFVIAEKDLELRGSGEFFGTRQSGEFDLRYSNPVQDQELLEFAHGRATELVAMDPELRRYPALQSRFSRRYAHKLEYANAG